MAMTKIAVQQLSDELFKIVGRNYLYVSKAKVTNDDQRVILTKADFVNAESEVPSWKEVKNTSFIFVIDTETQKIITQAKLISIDTVNDQITILPTKTLDEDLKEHIEDKENPHEVKANQVEFTPSDSEWEVENTAEALDDLKLSKQDNLTFDNEPTEDSENPVTSDGIFKALAEKIDVSEKGEPEGVATLDENGKVPTSQLPSYVDDVIEGYMNPDDGKFYEEASYETEIEGESDKIYVDLSTNLTYRWSGSQFVEISKSLALGETENTAYRGDRGKEAYDHSQIDDGSNPHNTTPNNIEFEPEKEEWEVTNVEEALNDLQDQIDNIDPSVAKKITDIKLATNGVAETFDIGVEVKDEEKIYVFYNGVKLYPTVDYSETKGEGANATITTLFDEPASATDILTVQVIK